MTKKIIVLGATGSIGKSALDIIRSMPDRFTAAGFSCHVNETALLALGQEFPGSCLALSGAGSADSRIAYTGTDGLLTMIEETRADCVVNGISGAAGFLPSVKCLEAGKTLALANKETLVMAGSLIQEIAARGKTPLIPVDSEHSAVFQLVNAFGKEALDSVILTASGGAFRSLSREDLTRVTPQDALKHPTWNMGKKITIDSASLANKGLEVIEAHHLFGMPPEKIKVLIHPQSHVHSLIETQDGALYAQIGKPDMRAPILNALLWPEVPAWEAGKFSLDGMSLSFCEPDTEKYPMLPLAYECLRRGASCPLVYNAANEVAVEAFMAGRLSFLGIAELVTRTVEARDWPAFSQVDEVLHIDAQARKSAERLLNA